jgi:hypothetical protein
MWSLTQSGLATALVDCTSDLSPLLIGLLGLLGFSAGFIILAALREHLSQKPARMKEPPTAEDRRDAA